MWAWINPQFFTVEFYILIFCFRVSDINDMFCAYNLAVILIFGILDVNCEQFLLIIIIMIIIIILSCPMARFSEVFTVFDTAFRNLSLFVKAVSFV